MFGKSGGGVGDESKRRGVGYYEPWTSDSSLSLEKFDCKPSRPATCNYALWRIILSDCCFVMSTDQSVNVTVRA